MGKGGNEMRNFGDTVKSTLKSNQKREESKKTRLEESRASENRKQKDQAKKDARQKLDDWKNEILKSAKGGEKSVSLSLGSLADGTEAEFAYLSTLVDEGVRLLKKEGLNATSNNDSWYPDHGPVDTRSTFGIKVEIED